MGVCAIIPARYQSVRLPGKPLLKETGKYLIQHVWERVQQARGIDEVIVATDDERILRAVVEFGGRAVMTSQSHKSGTDRVAEVARSLEHEFIINVQGDEPEIAPSTIERVVALLKSSVDMRMVTMATPIRTEEEYRDPNTVKVIVDSHGWALYFSRAPIPYFRIRDDRKLEEEFAIMRHMSEKMTRASFRTPHPLKHISIYGYRKEFLLKMASMRPTSLELIERLEQLRSVEKGLRIRVGITQFDSYGIDTAEDYEAFVRRWRSLQALKQEGL